MTATAPTSPFPHAVASFEPTSSAVLLWTRVCEGVGDVDWSVATDPGMARRGRHRSGHHLRRAGPHRGRGRHRPRTGHDLLVPVPRRGDSPVGRTRTLPATGVDPFRLATVCCARYSVAPLGVYRALAEREVDLVLHLGDYIYEDDGATGRVPHDPPHAATSLDDYRRRIAQIRSDPDAQALHLRHPMVTIWDDHDLADNAWRDGAKPHDDDVHGPWPRVPAPPPRLARSGSPPVCRLRTTRSTTWRSMLVGDLAEVLLLDTRLRGRDRQAGDDESPDLDDPVAFAARRRIGRAAVSASALSLRRNWASDSLMRLASAFSLAAVIAWPPRLARAASCSACRSASWTPSRRRNAPSSSSLRP